jgi:hypothetical protein
MNFGPKVGPLVAELLSGITALLIVYCDLHGLSFKGIDALSNGAMVLLLLLAWILGTFIDASRNVLEWVWDHYETEKVDWTFFFSGDKDRLEHFEHYFWSFYILDADMGIAITLSVILSLFMKTAMAPWYLWLAWIVADLVFVIDARLLRREIKDLLNAERK